MTNSTKEKNIAEVSLDVRGLTSKLLIEYPDFTNKQKNDYEIYKYEIKKDDKREFAETGLKLAKIHKEKLYLIDKYKTFEEFCIECLGYSDTTTAYSKITAINVFVNLYISGRIDEDKLPNNTSVANELSRIKDKQEQVAIWEIVVKESEKVPKQKITAKFVKGIIEEHQKKKELKTFKKVDKKEELENFPKDEPDEIHASARRLIENQTSTIKDRKEKVVKLKNIVNTLIEVISLVELHIDKQTEILNKELKNAEK